jgi:hypothetical protein
MIKLSILILVAILFADQYKEILGNRAWLLAVWVFAAALWDYLYKWWGK